MGIDEAAALMNRSVAAVDGLRLLISGREIEEPRLIELSESFAVLGRSDRAAVTLASSQVSYRHAYLQVIDGHVFCVDLASKTGLFWGDVRRSSGWLTLAQSVRIGPYRVQLVGDAPSAAPSAADDALANPLENGIMPLTKHNLRGTVRAESAMHSGHCPPWVAIFLRQHVRSRIMAPRRCDMIPLVQGCFKCGAPIWYSVSPAAEYDPFAMDVGMAAACETCGEINYLLGTAKATSFRFREAAGLRRDYTNPRVIHAEVCRVHRDFQDNMDRVLAFGRLPQLFRFHFEEFRKHFKPISLRAGITARSGQRFKRPRTVRIAPRQVDSILRFVPSRGMHIALDGLLRAMITESWLAFEKMAGDLWEAALNIHPRGLADLQGNCLRIHKKVAQRLPGLREPQKRKAETFPVHPDMGTWHRQNSGIKFTSLSEIRSAYSRAFKRSPFADIDKALGHPSLDALAKVRNVLVHKSGIADSEYVDAARVNRLCPQLSFGDHFEPRGDQVARLVKPVIRQSLRLLVAIDARVIR